MPIGIQRLNAHQTHPNDRVVFIKPLPGPTAKFAQDFLSRIAAICKPIMAAAHISVMTLEEYEPNPEFVGRNFNAGEIIQLVLKAPRTGHWLSFRSVQMVMMHELAHCLQMNHGREFWKVRSQFAGELKELWGKGYTGDGFWGRGKTLLSDQYDNQGSWEDEIMPERLCGGTYRTRKGRKRKRGGLKAEELTYAERKQRRIEKKFGKNGQALGSEEEARVKLENGKKSKGKPRVAGSARGRELRAAAALARFGQQKEEEEVKKEEKLDWSETESEDDLEDVKSEEGAMDVDGSRLLDSKGRGMVKVCEDEDEDDVHVKQEMDELQGLAAVESHRDFITPGSRCRGMSPEREQQTHTENERDSLENAKESGSTVVKREPSPPAPSSTPSTKSITSSSPDLSTKIQTTPPSNHPSHDTPTQPTNSHISTLDPTCPICSLSNDPSALICLACSHVLQPRLMPGNWRCGSSACGGSEYLNAGDCGRCGVCGGSKSGCLG
ncbi:MAG: hypothetical protein LQ350_001922 [Teloschistes chrysophthalmus]|nr:MAG: hypothetical protein LQ350_001922 [Niorma chrysophthalma]